MTNLTVDRLTLRLSGVSEGEARRLSGLIAEGLSTAEGAVPGRAANSLSVSLDRVLGEDVEALAARVVDALMDALRSS